MRLINFNTFEIKTKFSSLRRRGRRGTGLGTAGARSRGLGRAAAAAALSSARAVGAAIEATSSGGAAATPSERRKPTPSCLQRRRSSQKEGLLEEESRRPALTSTTSTAASTTDNYFTTENFNPFFPSFRLYFSIHLVNILRGDAFDLWWIDFSGVCFTFSIFKKNRIVSVRRLCLYYVKLSNSGDKIFVLFDAYTSFQRDGSVYKMLTF